MSWPVPNTLMLSLQGVRARRKGSGSLMPCLASVRRSARLRRVSSLVKATVLKNSPHPQRNLIMGDGNSKWERPTCGRRLPALSHTWKRRSSGPQLLVSTTNTATSISFARALLLRTPLLRKRLQKLNMGNDMVPYRKAREDKAVVSLPVEMLFA